MVGPRISVVIPCRNEARYLANQLAALAAQSWQGCWEVVVADNGSTDASREVAQSFARVLPSLRVVDAGDGAGRQHACNVGARAAEGDALVFVDGDDEVAPGYLAAMARALAEHQFVGARLDNEALNPPWLRRSRVAAQADGLQDWHFLPVAAGGSIGIRRSTFLELGGFDEGMHYAEDAEFCFRAQLAGVRLHFVPDAVLRHRYRHRTGEIYRQARGYGRGGPVLYGLYDSPVVTPARKVAKTVETAVRVLARVPQIGKRGVRASVAWDIGYLVGWAQGSVRPGRYCQPQERRAVDLA